MSPKRSTKAHRIQLPPFSNSTEAAHARRQLACRRTLARRTCHVSTAPPNVCASHALRVSCLGTRLRLAPPRKQTHPTHACSTTPGATYRAGVAGEGRALALPRNLLLSAQPRRPRLSELRQRPRVKVWSKGPRGAAHSSPCQSPDTCMPPLQGV